MILLESLVVEGRRKRDCSYRGTDDLELGFFFFSSMRKICRCFYSERAEQQEKEVKYAAKTEETSRDEQGGVQSKEGWLVHVGTMQKR